MIAALFLVALFLWHWFNGLSQILVLYYAAISAGTYMIYAWDKLSAVQGRWRIREYHLHLLSILGGWPGALLAQQSLRHKTIKASFRRWFWLTVLGNLIVLLVLEYLLMKQL